MAHIDTEIMYLLCDVRRLLQKGKERGKRIFRIFVCPPRTVPHLALRIDWLARKGNLVEYSGGTHVAP